MITGAQVLLVATAIAEGVAVLMALGGLVLAASAVDAAVLSSSAAAGEIGPARAALSIVMVAGLARAVFAIWATIAVGQRRTLARLLITTMPLLDATVVSPHRPC